MRIGPGLPTVVICALGLVPLAVRRAESVAVGTATATARRTTTDSAVAAIATDGSVTDAAGATDQRDTTNGRQFHGDRDGDTRGHAPGDGGRRG